VSLVTVILGALAFIQIALLWGSFLSTTWIEEHVVTSISWLNPPIDTLVRSMDLGSIVGVFASVDHNVAVAVLALTTVIVPCLTMVMQPMNIMERHNAVLLDLTFEGKSWVDCFTRFGFLLVFCLLLLDIALSHIQLDLTETQIIVYNCMDPGFTSFVLGLTLAMIVATMLRICRVTPLPILVEEQDHVEDHQYMRVLEEEAGEEGRAEMERSFVQRHCKFWSKDLFVFECVLLSIFCFVAAFVLPLAQVTYSGVAADFLAENKLRIHLGQLSHELAKGTSPNWVVALCRILVVLQVIVCPVLATIVAITSWFGNGTSRIWLQCIYPAVNGLTLSVAAFLIFPALESLGRFLLNEDTSGLCQKFEVITGESCLIMKGVAESGTWCLLAHAIALEAFILLTLRKAH
jgi:hypothetical protein